MSTWGDAWGTAWGTSWDRAVTSARREYVRLNSSISTQVDRASALVMAVDLASGLGTAVALISTIDLEDPP